MKPFKILLMLVVIIGSAGIGTATADLIENSKADFAVVHDVDSFVLQAVVADVMLFESYPFVLSNLGMNQDEILTDYESVIIEEFKPILLSEVDDVCWQSDKSKVEYDSYCAELNRQELFTPEFRCESRSFWWPWGTNTIIIYTGYGSTALKWVNGEITEISLGQALLECSHMSETLEPPN